MSKKKHIKKGDAAASGGRFTAEAYTPSVVVYPCYTGSGSSSGCQAGANHCSGSGGYSVYTYSSGILSILGNAGTCPDIILVTEPEKAFYDIVYAYDPDRRYYVCCGESGEEMGTSNFNLLAGQLEQIAQELKKKAGCGCGGGSKPAVAANKNKKAKKKA